jgi:endoglucanase
MRGLPFLLGALSLVATTLAQKLPLHTSSRWILDANNQRVKMRCVNWSGHLEVNIPEGLDKQSIDTITTTIKNQGFNCVRLTYSIDQALNPNLPVSQSFLNAAAAASVSQSDMVNLYHNALAHNPFLSNATTQDVFGAVVDSLWSKGIMTLFDNHVSKATWCCNLDDGNGWWKSAFGYIAVNSQYFITQDWLNGLQTQAIWAKAHPGVVAMSLRNELRQLLFQNLNHGDDWYNYVTQAAQIVHAANPDVLIVVGGPASATDLTSVRSRNLDFSGWAGKHVWEFHAYSFTVTFPNIFSSCKEVQLEYGAFDGFLLNQGKPYTAPLILSEFGVGMSGGPNSGLNDQDNAYLSCLVNYMTSNDAEWALWAVQGSYYIRQGTIDYDEGWGLLTHDWSALRNPAFPAMLGGMWNVTQGP